MYLVFIYANYHISVSGLNSRGKITWVSKSRNCQTYCLQSWKKEETPCLIICKFWNYQMEFRQAIICELHCPKIKLNYRGVSFLVECIIHYNVWFSDALNKWCKLVATHIGTDWAKLYRKLPMIPSRGDAERDEDLVKIVTNQWRSVQNNEGLQM